jgi:hypothetical protein
MLRFLGKYYKNKTDLWLSYNKKKVGAAVFRKNIKKIINKIGTKNIKNNHIIKAIKPIDLITYKGKEYDNLKTLLIKLNLKIPYQVVNVRRNRLKKKGITKLNDKIINDLFSNPGIGKLIKGIVYLAENKKNSKKYVGITGSSLQERISSHLIAAATGKMNKKSFSYVLFKEGVKNFKFKELEVFKDPEKLKSAEKNYIKIYKTKYPDGYNLQEGGISWSAKGKRLSFKNKNYSSFNELCRFYNKNPDTVRSRLNRKWGLERSLSIKEWSTSYRATYKYKEKIYESLKMISTKFKIKVTTLRYRLNQGLTVKEAIEMPTGKRIRNIKR